MREMNGDVGEVPRIENPNREEFARDWLTKGRPVIITGAAAKWPATSQWTTDLLRERLPSKTLPISYYPRGDYYRDECEFKDMTLGQYFDLISSSGDANRHHYYLEGLELRHFLP